MATSADRISDYQTPRFARYVTEDKTASASLTTWSCSMIRFTAAAANAGATGYKGTSRASEAQASGDVIPVAPGASSGWIPCFNADQFAVVVASGDHLGVEYAN